MRMHGVVIRMAVAVGLGAGAGGCRSTRGGPADVLVPGAGGRPERVVQVPADWVPTTVRALRASPGCLGVEVGQMQSGKRSIFALFKDKPSAVAWYGNLSHQRLVETVKSYRDQDHVALSGVADDSGPILVIATMTPGASAGAGVTDAMLLSVELFSPLPGGVRFGGASFVGR